MSFTSDNLRYLVLAGVIYVFCISFGFMQNEMPVVDRGSLDRLADNDILLTLPVDWRQTKMSMRSEKLPHGAILKNIDQWILHAKQRQDSRYLAFAGDWLDKLIVEESSLRKVNALKYRQADISQYEHNFVSAIEILTQIIDSEANQFNAILARSNLYTIVGAYKRAIDDCKQLPRVEMTLIYLTCVTQNTSRQGNLHEDYFNLTKFLEAGTVATGWSYSIAADMARRLGKYSESLRWIEKGLKVNPGDHQLRTAKADLLIEVDSCGAIHQWIRTLDMGEIYITVIKARCNNIPIESIKRVQSFVQQVNYDKRAADHRLLAELHFYVLKNADAAQDHALKNWLVQKEPEDFRLAYRIAIHYKNAQLLNLLNDWRRQNRYEDKSMVLGDSL